MHFCILFRNIHTWNGKKIDFVWCRTAEMLHAWGEWNDGGQMEMFLQGGRRALSLFQHHDGITGTARDHVVKDYARQMMDALKGIKFVIQQAVYRYLTKPSVCINKLILFV